MERLNLSSVESALDEVVSGLQNIESSNKDLLVRKQEDDNFIIKRHIPTKNGALLMSYYPQKNGGQLDILKHDLVTWVHKKQFYKNQEVTYKEFNLVQKINYDLSALDKDSVIAGYKKYVEEESKHLDADQYIVVDINGIRYPWKEFITPLEKGKYLDFIIDFEKES